MEIIDEDSSILNLITSVLYLESGLQLIAYSLQLFYKGQTYESLEKTITGGVNYGYVPI